MSRSPSIARFQRPRDRRGGHRQHVHGGAHRLEALLVLHAEPLLLVDHDQPEVADRDRLAEQPVRSDHDVDRAVGEPLLHRERLLAGAKARQHLDVHRVARHALAKRVVVLAREHRRRHEHGDLPAIRDRLERRAHRDLGLAVADVAAQQPVHRARALHVRLHRDDRGELVGRLLVRKRRLELVLHRLVGSEREAGLPPTDRLDLEQPRREVRDRLLDAVLDLRPRLAAELRELGAAARRADVLLQQVDLRDRHVHRHLAREFDDAMLLRHALALDRAHAAEAADAVREVHDVVAGFEIEEVVDRARGGAARRGLAARQVLQQVVVAEDRQPGQRERQAQPPLDELEFRRLRVAEQVAHARLFRLVAAREKRLVHRFARLDDALAQRLGARGHRFDLLDLEGAFPAAQCIQIGAPAFLPDLAVDLHAKDRAVFGEVRQQVAERVLRAARRELDRVDGVGRALRLRREGANRFDLVAEVLQAHGRVAARREEVDDVAADRELARRGDERDAIPLVGGEAFGQLLRRPVLAPGGAA